MKKIKTAPKSWRMQYWDHLYEYSGTKSGNHEWKAIDYSEAIRAGNAYYEWNYTPRTAAENWALIIKCRNSDSVLLNYNKPRG